MKFSDLQSDFPCRCSGSFGRAPRLPSDTNTPTCFNSCMKTLCLCLWFTKLGKDPWSCRVTERRPTDPSTDHSDSVNSSLISSHGQITNGRTCFALNLYISDHVRGFWYKVTRKCQLQMSLQSRFASSFKPCHRLHRLTDQLQEEEIVPFFLLQCRFCWTSAFLRLYYCSTCYDTGTMHAQVSSNPYRLLRKGQVIPENTQKMAFRRE